MKLNDPLTALMDNRSHDPFAILGPHSEGTNVRLRVLRHEAQQLCFIDHHQQTQPLQCLDKIGLFEWFGPSKKLPKHYQLTWIDRQQQQHTSIDPYSFKEQLSDFDLHLFNEGQHWHLYNVLGANETIIDGIEGILFATWAPNAEAVHVVGDFNQWDNRRHPMRPRGQSGVWELFLPGIAAGCHYKYAIRHQHSQPISLKSDPYAKRYELRPKTSSMIQAKSQYQWQDQEWTHQRAETDWLHQPYSIYEVHLGSWCRDDNHHFLNYRKLAHRLVDYVKALGFTHIELLPITEHPFDGSWGYQTIGYFAPTSRFGKPDDLRYFINYCHQHQLGVLLDWVPAHFPKDEHGLFRYDGTALYEHDDPRRAEHKDWGTLIYNYGRNEVSNFLIASALYWLDQFHFDGLRVDAVASMLYLDYSRENSEWLPNELGSNENLQAIDFLRTLNHAVHQYHPDVLMIAEESTAWPQVTRPATIGGLGFSMKWNLGWMHDSLTYLDKDPIHRKYHHDLLTFPALYANHENFILSLSHDEVVHGKRSLLYKMPGDEWQQFANLRLLYTYFFTWPGKKLLFMGNEFAQEREWAHDEVLDWSVLNDPLHQGIQRLVTDLNHLYTNTPALHYYDFEHDGFEWLDCHDADQSVISYLRKCNDTIAIVVLNFTPVPRFHYRLGVPYFGTYHEAINSDSSFYGGSNIGNRQTVEVQSIAWMQQPYSIDITLPPLAGLIFIPNKKS
ncbi:1,4-alpha-glucan branching enzyme [Candidatus Endobugula sertula]|uniref:1,4-alpha-glucan branching enzyme GlgB n=1 Tax=Candidatus Endobugula sertula TaxID=62101 RepID=A0A1D2QSC8_9GAMM|nr:1,4-alpha-glucan branching enzyme [Candidatus Endobugula sertula]